MSGAHLVLQLLVGCGDNAHVDRDHAVAADAHDRPFLDHAQQLALQRQRHLVDLVEEESAAVRKLKKTGLTAFFRTGKGAFFVAH